MMPRLFRTLPLLVVLAGCGSDSPMGPSVAQIGGGWSGTFESSNWGVRAILVDLTQAGDTVNGTYAINGAQGNISGTVTATNFSGTITMTTPSVGGGICNGSGTLSGPVSNAQTMRWTSVGITTTNCGGMPVGIVLNLQRR